MKKVFASIAVVAFVFLFSACSDAEEIPSPAPTATPIQSIWMANSYCDNGAVGNLINPGYGARYLYRYDTLAGYRINEGAEWIPCDVDSVLEITWRGPDGALVVQRLVGPMHEKIEPGLYETLTALKK